VPERTKIAVQEIPNTNQEVENNSGMKKIMVEIELIETYG